MVPCVSLEGGFQSRQVEPDAAKMHVASRHLNRQTALRRTDIAKRSMVGPGEPFSDAFCGKQAASSHCADKGAGPHGIVIDGLKVVVAIELGSWPSAPQCLRESAPHGILTRVILREAGTEICRLPPVQIEIGGFAVAIAAFGVAGEQLQRDECIEEIPGTTAIYRNAARQCSRSERLLCQD